MPKKRLAKLYERSIKNEFSFIKSRLSKLKAEKVVSPPQNPTIKKRDILELVAAALLIKKLRQV